MRKRIEIRVDAGYYELLQRTAALHGMSLAELVRRYVADGLARDAGLLAVAGSIAGNVAGSIAGTDAGSITGNGAGSVAGADAGNDTGVGAGKRAGKRSGAAAGNITGGDTGAFTGNGAGKHTGAGAGNVAGAFTGNSTGNSTGNVAGTGPNSNSSPFSLSNKEKDNKGDYEVIPDEVVKEKGKANTVGNKRGGGDSDGGRGERGGAGEREGKGVRALGALKEVPAVREYRRVMGMWPRREEAEVLAEQVEGPAQLEVWRRVLETWSERAWNPRNVQGMLERYRDELARGARLVEVSYQEALHLWDKMGNVGKFPGWFIEQARKYGEVEGIRMPDGKIGWRLPARFVAKVKSGNWDYFKDVLHVNGA